MIVMYYIALGVVIFLIIMFGDNGEDTMGMD